MNANLHYSQTLPEQQLSLNGQIGYRIDGDRISINIEEIASNRRFDNLSGTLSLELWALPSPYQGQDFTGFALAATSIGELFGQHCLRDCHYDLNFQQPPAGAWNLVLMLREWESGAYITRDFVNFDTRYQVASQVARAPVSRNDADNVISIAFGDGPAATTPAATTPAATKKPPAQTKLKADPQPKVESKSNLEQAAPATAKPKAEKTLEQPKAAEKAKTPEKTITPEKTTAQSVKTQIENELVSINKAMLSELEAIKGVSRKLAKTIFDSRPFESIEELVHVKGMGKKLLKKLEGKIKL